MKQGKNRKKRERKNSAKVVEKKKLPNKDHWTSEVIRRETGGKEMKKTMETRLPAKESRSIGVH